MIEVSAGSGEPDGPQRVRATVRMSNVVNKNLRVGVFIFEILPGCS